MSKKLRAYSVSKIGLEPPDSRKAFYAGWDAALTQKGTTVNQHDQMRDKAAFLEARREQALNQLNSFFYAGVKAAEDWQALAHVNETPKNEHDSDDLLNKSGNADMIRKALRWYEEQARLARLIHSEGDKGRQALERDGGERARQALAAEPATLVRLTDDSLISIYLTCKAEWKATNKRERERIAVLFGHAIMDAIERVNK